MNKNLAVSAAAFLAALVCFGVVEALARPCDITVPTEQPTIQAAIDSAADGNKICVKPGTYTEDLFIGIDNLELAGSGFPTIEGVSKGDTAVNPFPTAVPNIDIQANGVSIHNFTIMSPSITSATEYASGIVLTGTDIEIYKNHFVVSNGTPGSQAIQTWREDNAPVGLRDISGLQIDKNRFTSAGSNGFGYEAIFINPQSDPVHPGKPVVIEKNFFSGNLYRAIGVERDNTVIEKNKMSTDLAGAPIPTLDFGDVPWGIKIFDGSDVEIEKNKIGFGGAGLFNVGIRLESTVTDASVEKNHIKNPATAGISVAGDDNSFSKNKVMGSGIDGIVVELDAIDNTFMKNIIKGSGTWDVLDDNGEPLVNDYKKNNCQNSSPAVICTP